MYKILSLSMLALVIGLLTDACTPGSQVVRDEQKAARKIARYDARTFFETVTMFGASFSHDEERLLITSDASGVFNAYSQSVSGGEPEALTKSGTDSIFGVSFFPGDKRVIYTQDQAGNELNHLFLLKPDGTTQDLTPGDKLKARFVRWSGDKKGFWVMTNERDQKFFDLYQYDAKTYERKRVFTNTKGWTITDVSRDGRWVALLRIHTNANNDLYVWDSAKPEEAPRHLTPHEGDVEHSYFTFSPDSKEFHYGTNAHGEFTQAWSVDLASGEHKLVMKADWDIWYVYFSENGKYRITGINQDARTVVSVLDTSTGKDVTMPDLPDGDVRGVSISASETKMAFYLNDDTSPSNLYVMDLQTGKHQRLSSNLNPAVKQEHLVSGEVIRYKSFDNLDIPAIQYKPLEASKANQVPALVWVHGGPGGQSRHGYRAMIQHLVNHGYGVLAVNNRGSTGYGKTFVHMDDKKHGDVDLKDCVFGRKYLESLDWVDAKRIGIIGGSYGGYMVAAALTFEPEVFDIGIDIFGVTNWLRTLQNIPPYWEAFKKYLYAEMGNPATDEERLRKISPLFHAKNIVRPLLVVQGANDPRVLKAESDEIVEAARKNGVPVEYVVFPDEGHGFLKKENRIKASESYVKFLRAHLSD